MVTSEAITVTVKEIQFLNVDLKLYLPIQGHDECNICTIECDGAINDWNGQEANGNKNNCNQFPIDEQLFGHQKHLCILRIFFP